ncbi:germinal center kinase 1-like isoform X2 [Balamuthia mandrillaris]
MQGKSFSPLLKDKREKRHVSLAEKLAKGTKKIAKGHKRLFSPAFRRPNSACSSSPTSSSSSPIAALSRSLKGKSDDKQITAAKAKEASKENDKNEALSPLCASSSSSSTIDVDTISPTLARRILQKTAKAQHKARRGSLSPSRNTISRSYASSPSPSPSPLRLSSSSKRQQKEPEKSYHRQRSHRFMASVANRTRKPPKFLRTIITKENEEADGDDDSDQLKPDAPLEKNRNEDSPSSIKTTNPLPLLLQSVHPATASNVLLSPALRSTNPTTRTSSSSSSSSSSASSSSSSDLAFASLSSTTRRRCASYSQQQSQEQPAGFPFSPISQQKKDSLLPQDKEEKSFRNSDTIDRTAITTTATTQRPTNTRKRKGSLFAQRMGHYCTLPRQFYGSASSRPRYFSGSNSKPHRIPSTCISTPFNFQHQLHVTQELNWNNIGSQDAFSAFVLEEKLGQGAYGEVFKASTSNGYTLVVKTIELEDTLPNVGKEGDGSETDPLLATNKRGKEQRVASSFSFSSASQTPTQEELLREEIEILKACKHPNIVPYFGTVASSQKNVLWILMEYCGVGSIRDLIELCDSPLNEDEIAVVCVNTLKGLVYLHSANIIHRDVKAANILVNHKAEIKIADFGVSEKLRATSKGRTSSKMLGTPLWMAPEVAKTSCHNPNATYDFKADVWSLGITVIEMAEGLPPNSHMNPLLAMRMAPNRPAPTFKEPEQWSPELNSFLAACLEKDPKQRSRAVDLLLHPFIQQAVTLDAQAILRRRIALCLQRRSLLASPLHELWRGSSNDERKKSEEDGNGVARSKEWEWSFGDCKQIKRRRGDEEEEEEEEQEEEEEDSSSFVATFIIKEHQSSFDETTMDPLLLQSFVEQEEEKEEVDDEKDRQEAVAEEYSSPSGLNDSMEQFNAQFTLML